MMKSFATLVRAAAASILLVGAANAAVFNIDTTPITSGGSGATAVCSTGGDSFCNFTIGLAPAIVPTFTLDAVTPTKTFPFLRFAARGVDLVPDNAVVNAVLDFTSPVATIGIGGSGSGITTLAIPFVGSFFTGTSLIWSGPVSQFIAGVGTVTVELQDVVFGLGGSTRSFIVDATVTLQPIPLPGGVLLLGTAMLGLFGLSRRRKKASA